MIHYLTQISFIAKFLLWIRSLISKSGNTTINKTGVSASINGNNNNINLNISEDKNKSLSFYNEPFLIAGVSREMISVIVMKSGSDDRNLVLEDNFREALFAAHYVFDANAVKFMERIYSNYSTVRSYYGQGSAYSDKFTNAMNDMLLCINELPIAFKKLNK
jgi:hypothetical protein